MKPLFLNIIIFVFAVITIKCNNEPIKNISDIVEKYPETILHAKKIGEECTDNEQCETNFCYFSEYAPFGVCTMKCDTPEEYCDNESSSFCVSFPDEFAGEVKTFCVLTCNSIDDCSSISPKYEKCEKPEYKNNPI